MRKEGRIDSRNSVVTGVGRCDGLCWSRSAWIDLQADAYHPIGQQNGERDDKPDKEPTLGD